MNKFLIGLLLVTILAFSACVNSEEYNKVKKDFRDTEYDEKWASFDSIYSKIPDYKNIASTITSLHSSFNAEVLLKPTSANNYVKSKENAFALGMFIADLGYVRHYERVQLCSEYLEAVRKLAGNLAIGEKEFNETVPLIESKMGDKEVLFSLVDSLMSEGNLVLASNEKHGLSALFLAGFWIETSYIGLSLQAEKNNEFVNSVLVSHFDILVQINKLFACLSDDAEIDKLKSQLIDIEKKGPGNRSLYKDILNVRNDFVK